MLNDNILFENIIYEGKNAWGIGTYNNAIFEISDNRYGYLKGFPDYDLKSCRVNAYIYKCDNEIYCFPDLGNKIWIYNVFTEQMSYLDLNEPYVKRVCIYLAFVCGDRLYAFVMGKLKKIIEIDTKSKCIVGKYQYEKSNESIMISYEGCLVGNSFFFALMHRNVICEFNTDTKEITRYEISQIDEITTICYDGVNFWMTGIEKRIYCWNKEKDQVIQYDNLPEGFGYCKSNKEKLMLFSRSINVREKIFFIPYQANKMLYLEKKTQRIKELNIPNETETSESLEREWSIKYRFLYLRENRYMGLYSFKNQYYFEIDIQSLEILKKSFIFEEKSMENYYDEIFSKTEILADNMGKQFIKWLERKKTIIKINNSFIGEKIYRSV